MLVGIIDTGIDGTHPDIAPNFDARCRRNFVTDMPDDRRRRARRPTVCVDPVDEDDDGHGTHVAATIGVAINGLGIAGIAPKVTLVNIRAGQDCAPVARAWLAVRRATSEATLARAAASAPLAPGSGRRGDVGARRARMRAAAS